MSDKQITPTMFPAYLGWANPEPSESSFRLYARDVDDSPRWDRNHAGGRTVEHACRPVEGDRYLVVRIGDRFVSNEEEERIAAAILDALTDESSGSTEAHDGE